MLYSPTPFYTHVLLEPCDKGDSKEAFFDCLNWITIKEVLRNET
jgi:hypothetical protein